MSDANQQAMFVLDKVQYPPPAPIITMAVSNNIMILVLDSHRALRIDLGFANQIEEIELPKKNADDYVTKVFIDPSGRHVIFSTKNGDNYYLSNKRKRARLSPKLKAIIESIAWAPFNGRVYDFSTRPILLGTDDGRILETEFESSDDRKDCRYLKQLYALPEKSPVTGLRYEMFPDAPKSCLVLATTPTRIYQFVGPMNGMHFGQEASPAFEKLFSDYIDNPVFQEILQAENLGAVSRSELCFYVSSAGDGAGAGHVPERFAFLTASGMYSGNIEYSNQNPGISVIDNFHLLPYFMCNTDSSYPENLPGIPISMALTEFHMILAYRDRVVAVCQLNDQLVYEEATAKGEVFRHLTMDPIKRTLWLHTDTAFYELMVTDEARDVWRLYLDKRAFDIALLYARTSAQRDFIRSIQGDQFYEQAKYQKAGECYAQSGRPFEEIALKFIVKEETEALMVYLAKWLEEEESRGRRTGTHRKMQTTMVATWLLELRLAKLNKNDDLILIENETGDKEQSEQEKRIAQKEFREFVDMHKDKLDVRTTYQMLESYMRIEQLLYYAQMIGDYERVIQHWITEGDYQKALEVLSKDSPAELYYKFSTVLIRNVPVDTVTAWMNCKQLEVRKLLPALLHYYHHKNLKMQNQAIRYLEFVVYKLGNRDTVIHNYLVMLYATQHNQNETQLLSFIQGTELNKSTFYNLNYALRVCLENHQDQSCVHLYSKLGMYEEAVELALKGNDVEMASVCADLPNEDDNLRKKLWLKIAQHVVEEKNDINTAMQYLQRSNLLKIEDVLPFFSDFALIDEFKSEICHALQEYNAHIEQLKETMNDATKSAETIRMDTEELKNRSINAGAEDRCAGCERPILARQFYAFPCHHIFHTDCLLNQVAPNLGKAQQQRLIQLQDKLSANIYGRNANTCRDRHSLISNDMPWAGFATPATNNFANRPRRSSIAVPDIEILREEMDEILASECVLCGEIMIRSIDRGFVSILEERDEAESWRI